MPDEMRPRTVYFIVLGSVVNPWDLHVFGLHGSGSGFVSQSTNPRFRIRAYISKICNIGFGRKNYVGPLIVFSI